MNNSISDVGGVRHHLSHYHPDTQGREDVEAFIAGRFLSEHGAHINVFMPHLLAVHNQCGRIVAAAGLRSGADEMLFLEEYLEQTIEGALSQSHATNGETFKREHIVEVGNLASSSLVASRFLFRELFKACTNLQYHWVVFTGCQRLCRAFKHLNLSLIKLADAQETQLSSTPGQWGSYYQDKPCVMAGRLADGNVLVHSDSPVGVGYA